MGYFADQWQKAAGTPMTVAFGESISFQAAGDVAARTVTAMVHRYPAQEVREDDGLYRRSRAQLQLNASDFVTAPALDDEVTVSGLVMGITEVRGPVNGRYRVMVEANTRLRLGRRVD